MIHLITLWALAWLDNIRGTDLSYILLILILFIIPRFFFRFGIPLGLSSFFMGLLAGQKMGLFIEDPLIPTFAILGVSSLFLFAGMEITLKELKENSKILSEHVFVKTVSISFLSWLISLFFSIDHSAAILLALGVLTPSAGFILDSLHSSKQLNSLQKKWVKSKSIAAEIVALLILLLISQSNDITKMILTLSGLIILALILPNILHKAAIKLARFAPGSEFSFLILLAVILGMISKKLGAFYLVGAFLVGFSANVYREHEHSVVTEDIIKSIKFFATFFMPFYFFKSGIHTNINALFSWNSLFTALVLFSLSVPLRILTILVHRKFALKESFRESLPIAISLMPTLIFGLVLAEILKLGYDIPNYIVGGLVINTIIVTAIPPLFFKFIKKRKDLENLSLKNYPAE